jgi:eukaryotic-like serine/threonine-protein kinase
MAQRQACVLAYSGRMREARAMSRSAVQLANEAGQPERAALYLAGVATREAIFGNSVEAERAASSALHLSRNRDVEYGAAFALAFTGDDKRTRGIIDDLEKRFPEDTYVKFTYVPTLRAILAENRGDHSQAIEQLEAETPYDLGITGTWFGFFGEMYPVYIRGLAYLSTRRGREAAAQFQKILDHPGVVGSDPIGAAARLQLARAYKAQEDTSKAKSAYQDFFALWKGADTNVPLLTKAKAEYASMF